MHAITWGLLTTLVRSQECNNCYAIVAAELLEHQMYTSFAISPLSVQQIMDCTGFGCNGGNMEDTMAYVAEHPVTNQFSYDGNCNTPGVTAEYEIHKNISEEELMRMLEKGPLGVADKDHFVLLGHHWLHRVPAHIQRLHPALAFRPARARECVNQIL